MKVFSGVVLGVFAVTRFGVVLSQAQVTGAPVSMAEALDTTLPASAGQGAFNTEAFTAHLEALVPMGMANYPKDSISVLVGKRATAWLARLNARLDTSLGGSPRVGPIRVSALVSGMQRDYLAQLAVLADREAQARQYIAERLAAKSLSVEDRVYTLRAAVQAFADPEHPNRLPIAAEYLRQLDALGPPALRGVIEGSYRLADAYYRCGVKDSVVKYGTRSLELMAQLPFTERQFVSTPFLIVADALVAQPAGRQQIDHLGALLRTLAWPTPELLAADSSTMFQGQVNRYYVDRDLSTAQLFGKPVPKIVGHYWLNTSHEHSYREQSLADGKIRIIEIGDFHCPACLNALPGMKRLQMKFERDTARFEVLYVTHTVGYWGVKPATPAEEVAALKEYYFGKQHLTFTIAVWAPDRRQTPEGDFFVPPSPNEGAFFVTGTPRFCVVDGQGWLRRVFTGYSRDVETQLGEAVNYLLRAGQ